MVRQIITFIGCLLTCLSTNATTFSTAQVKHGGYISLSLNKGTDFTCSAVNVVAAWQASNDNVTLDHIGQSDISVKVYGKKEGMTVITCNYMETAYSAQYGGYMPTGPMQTKEWTVIVSEDGDDYSNEEMTIYFTYHNILYVLDKWSKEAKVGNGIDDEHNALSYPPITDSYWDTPYNLGWNDLTIPSEILYGADTYTVTSIAWRAFARTLNIQKVTLPETIREIENEAFYWCINLEDINIPKRVKAINDGTFTLCRKLKSVTLPEYLESIGKEAFSDCQSLEEINIPAKCTSIGNDAFKWCKSLKTLIIDDGTETLNCGYTYGVSLDYEGDDLEKYRGQFADCPIEHLYIGRNLSSPTIENVNYNPLYSLSSNYCTSASGYKGREGKRYTTVEFGDCVEHIPDGLFWHSFIKNELILPNNLKTIGDNAFEAASGSGGTLNQYELMIPSTVEYIGRYAFQNCIMLRIVNCESSTPPTIFPYSFCNSTDGNYITVFKVPNGCGNAYRSTEGWSWERYRIIDPGEDVVTINVKTAGTLYDRLLAQDYQLQDVTRLKLKGTMNNDDWTMVKNMSNLYDIDLSDLNSESIPENQFSNNQILFAVKLPNALTAIGDNTFKNCTHLAGTITIPASCTEIGEYAFYNTFIDGFEYLGTLSIGSNAFAYCNNLTGNLSINGEGTVVHSGAFSDCNYKKLTIGRGVTVAGDCGNFEDLVLEDGVEEIYGGAFGKMKTLTILGTIKNLGTEALGAPSESVFVNNISQWLSFNFPTIESSPLHNGAQLYVGGEILTDLVVPAGVSTISKGAFYGSKSLETVKFPNSLGIIEDGAFCGCDNLHEIFLPNQIKSIGESAFSGCTTITKVELPVSITSIADNAFKDCSNLSTVVAHWDNPITVNNTQFANVSSDCYLYVPIGTATKYVNAGWNLPNMKAAGILTVTANNGGVISCYNTDISNRTEQIFFTPYKTFYIDFVPEDGNVIRKVKLEGVNVTQELDKGKLCIEEPEKNMSLSVVFADTNIVQGDANGDGDVSNADAISAANYILKNSPDYFYDYAVDMNDDDVINITDLIILINLILSH